MFEGPLLRRHRPHALEFTFQLTAGGLQGCGMQQEALHHSRKWLGQHILQGNRMVGVQLWVTRKGRAFPSTEGTPLLHSQRMLVRDQTPFNGCHALL